MRLIIAGSRTYPTSLATELFAAWSKSHPDVVVTEFVTGCCPNGPDQSVYGWGIPVKEFPPNRNTQGKAGGPRRNKSMALYADALLLVWDGKSPGSSNMRTNMHKLHKPIFEFIIEDDGTFSYGEVDTERINYEEGLYL